jgi:hypothetical protein
VGKREKGERSVRAAGNKTLIYRATVELLWRNVISAGIAKVYNG